MPKLVLGWRVKGLWTQISMAYKDDYEDEKDSGLRDGAIDELFDEKEEDEGEEPEVEEKEREWE